MIDLSKLTPAPWEAKVENGFSSLCGPPTNGFRNFVLSYSTSDDGIWGKGETDMAFIALARNAFDVMMRRGWHVWPPCEDIGWKVFATTASMDKWTLENHFLDPFTALVEADKWYREHVEAAAPQEPKP